MFADVRYDGMSCHTRYSTDTQGQTDLVGRGLDAKSCHTRKVLVERTVVPEPFFGAAYARDGLIVWDSSRCRSI